MPRFISLFFFIISVRIIGAQCASAEEDVLYTPQQFNNKLYDYCVQLNIDSFLEWANTLDNSINQEFQKIDIVVPESMDEISKERVQRWKRDYYDIFRTRRQTKAFLLAGEYYPYVFLLQSTAYAFHELPAVTRICVLLSGKLGCPEAETLLILENPTSEFSQTRVTQRINQARSDERSLCDLLKTPFVWNNIAAMDFLREERIRECVFDYVSNRNFTNPFIYLNAYFLADELNSLDSTVIGWLEKAQNLGSILATLQLHKLGHTHIESSPIVLANFSINMAHMCRFGRGVEMERSRANQHYQEALAYIPHDPFLCMEIAEFYIDLYMAKAFLEIRQSPDHMQYQIFTLLKEAHIRGDGDAARVASQFIGYLYKNSEPFYGFNEWNLPADNINEALTCVYEYAYLRQEDPILVSFIQELGKRTREEMLLFQRKAIRSIAFRTSMIQWGY